MPLTRTISAVGGSSEPIKAAVAASEPKRAALSTTIIDAFREHTDTGIGVIDFQRSKAALFPLASLAAVAAAFAAVGGTLATLAPVDDTKASSLYTLAGGGYVAPVAGTPATPDRWLTDNGSGNPPDEAAVAEVPAVAESDPFGLHAAIIRATQDTFTVQQLVNAIEDTLALESNAGKSAVVMINQNTKQILVRIADAAAIAAAGDVTAAVGSLAVFNGLVTSSTGAVRQFGE